MKIRIKNINKEKVIDFEGSIDEVAEQFVNRIRNGEYDFEDSFPKFQKGTPIKDAEALFNKITHKIIKEDLLKYVRHGDEKRLHMQGYFDDALEILSETKSPITMEIEKQKDGTYQVDKPFLKEGEKREDKIDTFMMIYSPDKIGIDKDGELTGGKIRVITEEERKRAKGLFDTLKESGKYLGGKFNIKKDRDLF